MRGVLVVLLVASVLLPAAAASDPVERATDCVEAGGSAKVVAYCASGQLGQCAVGGGHGCHQYPYFCLTAPYVFDPTCLITYM